MDIEKVKKYWNDRPCNIRHSNKEIGTKEYFEEVQNRRYKVEPHIMDFAEFPKWKDKKVLEIGCGIGTDSISFLKNGAHLTAVDLSEESIKIAKERSSLYGFQTDILFADAENLSKYLKPTTFDLIYSFGVLHHTPNPINSFKEITKYMNKESELRMMLYHKGAFKVLQILEQYDYDYSKADELIAKHSEAQTGCPVTYSYTPKEITYILNEVGLEVTEIKIAHIFPYKIEEYKRYEYVKESIWEMPESTFNEFQSKYGWHLLVTSKLKA
jgi:2-polyprenyl-3-methyl-5-hydroxy-6-metoxy-1,4-benzoquinol methylase